MIEFATKPGESRGFLHKRLGRAVKGFVTSGFSPTAAAAGFLSSGTPTRVVPRDFPNVNFPVRRPAPRSLVARPSASGAAGKELGRSLKLGGAAALGLAPSIGGGCIPPFRRDPVSGDCKIFLGNRPGRDTAPLQIGPGTPVGDAVMGRYGAALVPGSRIIDRAVCLRGMVVGDDGLCYNRSQIKNSERMWPRGRRPLLSGGEMRAISIASRAAGRLTRTAVRLQEIGLIKKPVTRKPPKKKPC